jgi:hypothetical protein
VPTINPIAMSYILPTLIALSISENAIAEKNIPDAKEEMFALTLEENLINIAATLPIKNAEDTIADSIMLCPNPSIQEIVHLAPSPEKKRKIIVH